MEYYDDNFGRYHDMDGEEEQDFYKQNQRKSVSKICVKCGRKVKLLPQYDKCNSCMERMESGADW